jgi:hypothetical protein
MTGESEALFIDPAVSDLRALLVGLRPGVEAVLLDGVRPAAPQMAEALLGRQDLGAVHIIAHGAPGRVGFAAGEWSLETLTRDAGNLAAIGQALAENGDLRLWSCETGAGADGEAFVEALEAATGAYVAAADRKVGAAALGGAWELSVGTEARPPLTEAGVAAYVGVLAPPELTVSGTIPEGPTTANVTYFVVERSANAIVGHITLPNASTFARTFRLGVQVASLSGDFDVGLFDDSGTFVPAGFTVEVPRSPTGAVGPRG